MLHDLTADCPNSFPALSPLERSRCIILPAVPEVFDIRTAELRRLHFNAIYRGLRRFARDLENVFLRSGANGEAIRSFEKLKVPSANQKPDAFVFSTVAAPKEALASRPIISIAATTVTTETSEGAPVVGTATPSSGPLRIGIVIGGNSTSAGLHNVTVGIYHALKRFNDFSTVNVDDQGIAISRIKVDDSDYNEGTNFPSVTLYGFPRGLLGLLRGDVVPLGDFQGRKGHHNNTTAKSSDSRLYGSRAGTPESTDGVSDIADGLDKRRIPPICPSCYNDDSSTTSLQQCVSRTDGIGQADSHASFTQQVRNASSNDVDRINSGKTGDDGAENSVGERELRPPSHREEKTKARPLIERKEKTTSRLSSSLSLLLNRAGCEALGFRSLRGLLMHESQISRVVESLKKVRLDGLVVYASPEEATAVRKLAIATKEFCTVVAVIHGVDGLTPTVSRVIPPAIGFDTARRTSAEYLGNIANDGASSRFEYHFVRVGRELFTLETALSTRPALVLLAEDARNTPLKQLLSEIADAIIERAEIHGRTSGVVLVSDEWVEQQGEIQKLRKELAALLSQASAPPSGKANFILSELSPEARETFDLLPDNMQTELLNWPVPDPRVSCFSPFNESEVLVAQLVGAELYKRDINFTPLVDGGFVYRVHNLTHARHCALPSDFDCCLGYTLAHTAIALIAGGYSGYFASVGNLNRPVRNWTPLGVPAEVVEAACELPPAVTGPNRLAFQTLRKFQPIWRRLSVYRCSGPTQFVPGTVDVKLEQYPLLVQAQYVSGTEFEESVLSKAELREIERITKDTALQQIPLRVVPRSILQLSPLQILRLSYMPQIPRIFLNTFTLDESDVTARICYLRPELLRAVFPLTYNARALDVRPVGLRVSARSHFFGQHQLRSLADLVDTTRQMERSRVDRHLGPMHNTTGSQADSKVSFNSGDFCVLRNRFTDTVDLGVLVQRVSQTLFSHYPPDGSTALVAPCGFIESDSVVKVPVDGNPLLRHIPTHPIPADNIGNVNAERLHPTIASASELQTLSTRAQLRHIPPDSSAPLHGNMLTAGLSCPTSPYPQIPEETATLRLVVSADASAEDLMRGRVWTGDAKLVSVNTSSVAVVFASNNPSNSDGNPPQNTVLESKGNLVSGLIQTPIESQQHHEPESSNSISQNRDSGGCSPPLGVKSHWPGSWTNDSACHLQLLDPLLARKPGAPLRVCVCFLGRPAPGAINVMWGLLTYLQKLGPPGELYAALEGTEGLIKNKTVRIDEKVLLSYVNLGGIEPVGRSREHCTSQAEVLDIVQTCQKNVFHSLVLGGGFGTISTGALLAETFAQCGGTTGVTVVPISIESGLPGIELSLGHDSTVAVFSSVVGSLMGEARSSNCWYFIRVSGKKLSLLCAECALATHPSLVLIGEEVDEKKLSLVELTNLIADVVEVRALKGLNYGVLLVSDNLLDHVPELKSLFRSINAIFQNASVARLFEQKGGQWKSQWRRSDESISLLRSRLTPWSAALFASLPRNIQWQIAFAKDQTRKVDLASIDTEVLLRTLVEAELLRRKSLGGFRGASFDCKTHVLTYQGRAALPSNFDCDLGFSLGYTAAILADGNRNGYLVAMTNLRLPVADWVPEAMPLSGLVEVHLAHDDAIEQRRDSSFNSDESHVDLKYALHVPATRCTLESAPYQMINLRRPQWMLNDCFCNPGPYQFDFRNYMPHVSRSGNTISNGRIDESAASETSEPIPLRRGASLHDAALDYDSDDFRQFRKEHDGVMEERRLYSLSILPFTNTPPTPIAQLKEISKVCLQIKQLCSRHAFSPVASVAFASLRGVLHTLQTLSEAYGYQNAVPPKRLLEYADKTAAADPHEVELRHSDLRGLASLGRFLTADSTYYDITTPPLS